MKIKNIILTMALMGCSMLAFGQTVEQRMDSLQLLIGQQTILHLKATARKVPESCCHPSSLRTRLYLV